MATRFSRDSDQRSAQPWGMTKPLPPGFQSAIAALSGPVAPHTADEAEQFKASCAREMARAEARRNPQPQLPLPVGCGTSVQSSASRPGRPSEYQIVASPASSRPDATVSKTQPSASHSFTSVVRSVVATRLMRLRSIVESFWRVGSQHKGGC